MQLPWITQKEELTRTKMVEHMRAGWPQGEALLKAVAETEIAWTVPPAAAVQSSVAAKRDRQLPRGFDSGSNKKSKGGGKRGHAQVGESGLAICKPWNDARHCPAKGGRCPQDKAHKCYVIERDGVACLATSHPRAGHPASP